MGHAAFAARRELLAFILIAHAPVLLTVGVTQGVTPGVAIALAVPVPVVLGVLGLVLRQRRHAALVVVAGLAWTSIALVHLTDGAMASHVHAIAIIALATLLQEWTALVFGLVALSVGLGLAPVVGPALAPQLTDVLAAGGIRRPWIWAILEPLLLPVVAFPSVVSWKALEQVQERAAELAWEAEDADRQAHRRRAQADLLLALTHRNQVLVERQLEELDELELDEPDPDALAGLFRLDHLATRMRRNAESLLVVAGEEPARPQGPGVALSEVVRAAVGEVEQYTRVEVVLAEDPTVAGTAAADLTHLLAELVDNATTFSARSTLVVVGGQTTPSGYELRVKDRGRGMTDQARHERNRQLEERPDIDLELTSELGLHVAARLAGRIGATVTLDRNANGGTTATLAVPATVLAEQAHPMRPLLAAALAALGSDEDELAEDERLGHLTEEISAFGVRTDLDPFADAAPLEAT